MRRENIVGAAVLLTVIAALAIGQVANSNYRAQGGTHWVHGGMITAPPQNTSLTSPTVTFSAVGRHVITLNSDANQTGIYPIGGTQYQILHILSGSGSNTMRFDDGTSMTIGANITVTEGQGDVLSLLCTNSEGDEWTRISNGDN